MTISTNSIPIIKVCGELRALARWPDDVPSHRTVRTRIADGKIRTVLVDGKQEIPRDDLPAILKLFGVEIRRNAA